MKMLIFDFRESEQEFFANNKFTDYELTFIKEPLNELTKLTEEQWTETDIVSVFINSNVTENVIKKFKNLRIIATRSTGYNHIDLKYCTQSNIAVFNVEQYGQTAVAQYTMGLILALVRNILPAYLDVQKNLVHHPSYEGRNLNKLTLGIIGCGAIGCGVAKLAHAFGMKILIHTIAKRQDLGAFVDYVTFDELLEQSDVISLHVPYSDETYHLLDKDEFKKMKKGVYIVNTARGELINTMELYENLIDKKVSGAALDVLECEHLSINNQSPEDLKTSDSKCVTNALINEKLLSLNNVIITPHIGYNTKESVDLLLETTFNNIRDYSKGIHDNRVC